MILMAITFLSVLTLIISSVTKFPVIIIDAPKIYESTLKRIDDRWELYDQLLGTDASLGSDGDPLDSGSLEDCDKSS